MNVAKLPPGPKGFPLLGSTLDYLRNPLAFLSNTAHSYGDTSYFKAGAFGVFLVTNPNHIEQVLVTQERSFVKGGGVEYLKSILGEGLLTSEGDFHDHQRQLVGPAFHRERIASYGTMATEYAARLCSSWQAGVPIDLMAEVDALTLSLIGQVVFGVDIVAQTDGLAAAFNVVRDRAWSLLQPLPRFVYELPLPARRRYMKASRLIDVTIGREIAGHRAADTDRGDILSILLALPWDGNDGMADKQVHDEVMTIFIGGYETFACALTWTLCLLSQHTGVEAQLHAELDKILGNRPPIAGDLPHLPYLEMVITEGLRLYPPAWSQARKATRDVEIGGVTIPAGSVVVVNQYITHRDPRFYTEPNIFDPLRWMPEERVKRPRFSYFPFGGGTRSCIGEHLARMAAGLALAVIEQKWRLRLAPGSTVETKPMITLRPKGKIVMVPDLRSSLPVSSPVRGE